MKIWYVTSECAPFSKSGGLADVAYSLPPVLKAAGNDVEIVTPLYRCVWDHFGGGLTFRGTYPGRSGRRDGLVHRAGGAVHAGPALRLRR